MAHLFLENLFDGMFDKDDASDPLSRFGQFMSTSAEIVGFSGVVATVGAAPTITAAPVAQATFDTSAPSANAPSFDMGKIA